MSTITVCGYGVCGCPLCLTSGARTVAQQQFLTVLEGFIQRVQHTVVDTHHAVRHQQPQHL
jgi:hypothetical protein